MSESQATTPPGDNPPSTAGGMSAFAAFTGLTTLAVFVQAVLAGEFVSQSGKAGWITAHSYVALVVIVFALITAIVAWRSLRQEAPQLYQAATVLVVLAVIQTGIGHAITDGGTDGLLVIHVPLALFIFGITIWLSAQGAQLQRQRARPNGR